MKRVHVQLTAGQLSALEDIAATSQRPVAVLVREAVDDWIARQEREQGIERALSAVGQFRSGLGDLAEEHDRYLGEDDR